MKSCMPEHETVVKVEQENGEPSKCGGCSHRVVSRYRLTSETDSEAVCGDCFGEWLTRINAEITL